MTALTEEPVVFGSGVEALRNALASRFSASLSAELVALGVDLERPQAAYKMDTWCEALRLIARHLAPELPEKEQFVHLGREFIRGFVGTGVGKAALAFSRVVGPRRTLLRMGRNFKQATNYIETETREVGPTELHLRIFTNARFLGKTSERTNLVTDYRRGVLLEVLQFVRVEGQVEIIEADPARHDATFRIHWR